MTLKRLIINYLMCHLSFVIFAFTLSFQNLGLTSKTLCLII